MLRRMRVLGFIPLLIIGLVFLGGCKRPSPEKIADHIVTELVSKLSLTPEQQAALNTTKVDVLAKMEQMKKGKDAHHDEVLAELQKDSLDQDKLKKMFAEHKTQRDDIAELLLDRFVKFHATLSAEQKTKLVEFLKEKDKHRQHFMEH